MAARDISGQLDIAAAAGQLGISRRTLDRLIGEGVLDPINGHRRGRKLFFREEDIAFLAAGMATGHPVRHLEPRRLVRIVAQGLEDYEDALELLHKARDVLLDPLEQLYRATRDDEALKLLTKHGRKPRHE